MRLPANGILEAQAELPDWPGGRQQRPKHRHKVQTDAESLAARIIHLAILKQFDLMAERRNRQGKKVLQQE